MARDMREWMITVERQLKEARRSGVPIAIKYAKDALDEANEALSDYKGLKPTNPIELTYQTALYADTEGVVRGRVTIDFPDVVFATDGTPITVTRYELQGRPEGYGNVHSAYPGHLLPGQSYPGTPGSVLFSQSKLGPMRTVAYSDTSSFTVEGITQGQTLRYRVRAVGGTFTNDGLWSQDIVIYVEKDLTPPPQPTAPRVRVERGVIMVDYDGAAVTGEMPADLDYVALAHGTESSPIGEVYRFSRSGGTYILPGAEYYDVQFFRLRARDQSKNWGPWSEQATGTATPLVDEDIILSRIDAAETIIDNAGALILESGETLLDKLEQAALDRQTSDARLNETQEKLNFIFPSQLSTVEGAASAASLAAQVAQGAADAAAAEVKIAIAAGQSAIPNGNFEYGDVHWSAASARSIVTSANARSGTKVLRIDGPAMTANSYPFTDYAPSSNGRSFYIEYWIRRTGTDTANLVGIYTQTKTSAGTLSGVFPTRVAASNFPEGVWTKVSGTLDVTVDAVETRFAPHVTSPTTNVYEFDDFLVVDITEARTAQKRADDAHALAGTAESNAQSALTMAGGKSRVYYSANLPSGTGNTDDTWRQTDATGDVIAEWRWTGAWTSQKITSEAISNLDVGKLTVGTGVISQLVAQHIAAQSGEFIELDVSQLRAAAATIDTAVIDKLWTDVVNSRQITTNMLLVGGGENLWVDQYFESDTATIGAIYTGAEVAPRGNIRTMKVRDHVASSTTQFEVVPGDTIIVEYTAKRVLGARNLRATVWLYAPDGTGVSSPFTMLSYFSEEVAVGAPDANGWQRYRSTSQIPEARTDVGKATLYFQIDQTAGAYDTEWLVSDVRLRRGVESEVIVDGAITTRKLTVTEDMTVALLAVHKVQAGEIEVNTLFADTTFTGSLNTHIGTFLTNEDGTGYTSTVTGQGLRVTYTDPTTGEVMDRVKLGTFDSDYFALTDTIGNTVASIDNTGAFSGRTFDVLDDVYLRGESLWTKLDSMGGNMVAWAQVPVNDNMSTTSEVGLFELGWEANDNPVRMYEFNLNNLLIDVTQAGIHGLRLRYTTDGSVPTISSPLIGFSYFQTSQAGVAMTPSFTRIIGSNNGPYLRVLVTLVEFASGVAKVYDTGGTGGQTHIYATVKDLGYTLPHTGSATSAGGTVYTGTASTAPTNPTATYTKEWGYNGVRSYLPNGDTYAYNTSKAYQGQSPAGYGNLSSMYTFPSLTSELSGATIHDIWCYLYFEHWYYNDGGTAEIRLHNNLTVPSTYTGMTTNGVNSTSWPKAAGRWVRLPSSLYDGFKTGAYRGFGLTGDGYICYGIANNARIKIKYTK